MADTYNPPLLLSHLKLFKQQADGAYASKADVEDVKNRLSTLEQGTITEDQINALFPEIEIGKSTS